jgi:hypothetical protein
VLLLARIFSPAFKTILLETHSNAVPQGTGIPKANLLCSVSALLVLRIVTSGVVEVVMLDTIILNTTPTLDPVVGA